MTTPNNYFDDPRNRGDWGRKLTEFPVPIWRRPYIRAVLYFVVGTLTVLGAITLGMAIGMRLGLYQ
jgi:hypothetical protein